jgi:hypothetical protein
VFRRLSAENLSQDHDFSALKTASEAAEKVAASELHGSRFRVLDFFAPLFEPMNR